MFYWYSFLSPRSIVGCFAQCKARPPHLILLILEGGTHSALRPKAVPGLHLAKPLTSLNYYLVIKNYYLSFLHNKMMSQLETTSPKIITFTQHVLTT